MSKLITVDFHDDTLFAVEAAGGVFVAPKPICDTLGIDWRKQRERINRDPILSEGMAMMTIPSPGGAQETMVLQLRLLPGWLFGIEESRVPDEAVRLRIRAYKREAYDVLYQHFYGPRVEGGPMMGPPLPPNAAREEPVRVRRQLVTEARHVFGERAAGRLWFALGLPIVPEMQEPQPQSSFGFTYTAVPAPAPPQPPGPA